MRIPSDFNDSNLYPRERSAQRRSQQRESTIAYRRLIRLAIALALIVVVMNQAANEAIYQPFFGPAGDAAAAGGLANASPSLVQNTQPEESATTDSERPPSGSDAALAEDQLPQDQRAAVADHAAALDRVVDPGVWHRSDADALYGYLDLATQESQGKQSQDILFPHVGVVSLLQQPEVFRGHSISVQGTVARAERKPAQANPYGITQYWQLWLRPTDGADRPLVAIVPSVPRAVAQVGAAANLEKGPQITVAGRYLKRLAYQSSIGADLAPVVVGSIRLAIPTPSQAARPGEPAEPDQVPLWMVIAVAVVAGLAVALLAMWRTASMARRSRQLRAATRPEQAPLLDGLEQIGHERPAGENQE